MNDQTILIVDDERHVTHLIGYKLEQAGLRVIAAHNGLDAYDLAWVHRPDLVVTDYQMPGMTGLELAMKLRECPQTACIPIMMVSGRGHKLKAEDLARTNIQHMIAKPFSPRALLDALGKILALGRSDGSQANAA